MTMKTGTSNRLKQIMSERNLKQIDILNLSLPYQKKFNVKLGKSTLSQYVNAVQSPDQNRIYLLAQTLGVSEAWLMGFDVPMNSKDFSQPYIEETVKIMKKLTESQQEQLLKLSKFELDNIIVDTVNIMSKSDQRLKKQIYRYAKLEYSEYEKEHEEKNVDKQDNAC